MQIYLPIAEISLNPYRLLDLDGLAVCGKPALDRLLRPWELCTIGAAGGH